ncbi:KAP family NTPase, partial [Bacteroidota bacterium]|nr:KAP family NTPase [Bacteroidota bacterium]
MASITDSPISKLEEDYLRIEKYAISLSKFIQQSDTPITVGLQGEWGTGKTSLMSLLLEQFNDEANRNEIASSWVNTWEYSMFKGAKETTPSVLKGMLDKLKDSCKERGVWTLKDDAKSTFNKAGKFLSGIANQVVANQTGINVKDAVDSNSESYVAEIAEVKKMISGLIQELINDEKNPVKKVVFFVDDLDRILPSDAVEVLESLKNIFDIPNCVFILAIDYDVVVKGLESKFGPKTKENEREFRSFFDKIIQVPFTMPVGAYDISSFLKNKLAELNVEINDEEVSQITKIVGYTVGNNPRSLKRYLNTFSLIKIIVLDDDEIDDANDINKIILFATLGIQISYPEIFRLLTQNPNYLDWNKEFGNKINIDLDEIIQDIQKVGESKLTDEAWEQLIWGICQKDPFLKVKAYNILELFNFLREVYENDKESLHEQLSSVLEFAAITNVDDDLAIKQVANKAYTRTYYEGIDGYFLDNKDNKLFTDEYISLLKTINEKIKEIYAEEISLGHILVDYSKSGGLVFNWKKKSGGKFFQIRIGKTE